MKLLRMISIRRCIVLLIFFNICHGIDVPRSSKSLLTAKAKSFTMQAGGIGGIFSKMGFNSDNNNNAMNGNNNVRANQVVKKVDGIRHLTLGGSGIIVSELGLGTQRWVSMDQNGPDEDLCYAMMDRAILGSGVNFLDTAESYPIPSGPTRPEGLSEQIIGKWIKRSNISRDKIVISSKITGGGNIKGNIRKDLLGSLKRLNTDYLDVYMLHWPARYSPQANWGQSLEYHHDREKYYKNCASFEEVCQEMGKLEKEGLIRGWGMCNDNAHGLTACHYISKALGFNPPVALQNDYSLLNRRVEEHGMSEAMSSIHCNTGFMAYNILAGGSLTGKYSTDIGNSGRDIMKYRGRFDEGGWGRTLYRYRSINALKATERYEKLAKEFGLSITDLALRFPRDREAVTTSLVGHTNMKQLEQSLKAFRAEPLSEDIRWRIDREHMMERNPIWNSERVGKDWYGEGEIGEPIP